MADDATLAVVHELADRRVVLGPVAEHAHRSSLAAHARTTESKPSIRYMFYRLAGDWLPNTVADHCELASCGRIRPR